VIMKSFLLAILTLILLVACSSSPSRKAGYHTVAVDPNRNTELAIRENEAGLKAMAAGKLDAAEKHFKATMDADVMYGPGHNNLGKLYYRQDKLYLAAWEFEYAAKLMPGRPEPRNNLGLVFERAGKLNDAIEAYSKARELAPDDVGILENLARAKFRRGDRDDLMREVLSELVLKGTRPEWTTWAREKLALLGGPITLPQSPPTLTPSE